MVFLLREMDAWVCMAIGKKLSEARLQNIHAIDPGSGGTCNLQGMWVTLGAFMRAVWARQYHWPAAGPTTANTTLAGFGRGLFCPLGHKIKQHFARVSFANPSKGSLNLAGLRGTVGQHPPAIFIW